MATAPAVTKPSKISVFLKKVRRQYLLSQEEMAKMFGLSQSTLSYLEGGDRDPNFSTLKKMIRNLTKCGIKFTLDDFMD